MATLTNADYKEIKRSIYQFGAGKEELKALAALPDKTQFMDAFQSMEDNFVGLYPTLKADIETALGVSITNPLAQKMIAGYLKWKIDNVVG